MHDATSHAIPVDSLQTRIPPVGADNYEVGSEIARGGMGMVLSAVDLKLNRTVALKMMQFDTHADEAMRRGFFREAEVLAMLAHPNIVPIHDFVWEDGMPLFYTMKMVSGRTLQLLLNDLGNGDRESHREHSLDRLLLVFLKICDAMTYAHGKGVLHRDLKPENIMLGEFGEVLVMDWGLAKLLGEAADPAGPEPAGTPEYTSPEQAMGLDHELDERSDIYSLGGILQAILALQQQVPGGLRAVVMKAMTRHKADRYPDVRSLAADVESYQHGFAPRAQKAGVLRQIGLFMLRHETVTVAMTMSLIAGGGYILLNRSRK